MLCRASKSDWLSTRVDSSSLPLLLSILSVLHLLQRSTRFPGQHRYSQSLPLDFWPFPACSLTRLSFRRVPRYPCCSYTYRCHLHLNPTLPCSYSVRAPRQTLDPLPPRTALVWPFACKPFLPSLFSHSVSCQPVPPYTKRRLSPSAWAARR